MQNIESKNKDKIIKWDYEVSVKKGIEFRNEWEDCDAQIDFYTNKKTRISLPYAKHLYEAREALNSRGNNQYSIVTNVTRFTWSQYLEAIGFQRMTVHRWLEQYDPIEQKLLTDDELQRKTEVKKREKLEHKEQVLSKVKERIKTTVKPDDWDKEAEKVYKKTIEENIEQEKRDKRNQRTIDEEVERLEKEKLNRSKPEDDYEKAKKALDGLSDLLNRKQPHREELGLSGNEEIKQDIMYDIIDEYLIKLDSDSRRIEALHNILKYIKRKINHYQTQVGV